jgi:diacylglycerol kinase (ATP)
LRKPPELDAAESPFKGKTGSVEAAIDRISFDHHSLSRRAKDIGSAAVFVALLLLALVWGLILPQRLL